MVKRIKQFFDGIVRTELFKHIWIVFVWDNVAKILGIIVTVILIRALSKEDYALYTFFWTSAMFFVGFISNGIDMAYVRFAAEEYSVRKRMPNDIYFLSIILCISIFLVLSPLVLKFSSELSLLMFKKKVYDKSIFLGFIAAIGLFLTGMISRHYQVQERYKKAGAFISFEKTLFFLLIVTMYLIWELSFFRVALLRIILLSCLAIFFIAKLLNDSISENVPILNLKRFSLFITASFWLILYFVTQSFFSYMDIFMISRLLTVDDVANYGVAQRYFFILLLMYPTIKTVLKVRMSKIDMVESVSRQTQFLKKWLRTSSALFIPSAIIIVLISDFLMNILNGPRYSESILPFKFLVVTAMLYYIFSANMDIFRAKNKYFPMFCFGLMAVIINFFLNLWLIPIYGIAGAAFATLVSELIFEGSATLYILYR